MAHPFPPPNNHEATSPYATNLYNWAGWGYGTWDTTVWGQEDNRFVHRGRTGDYVAQQYFHRSTGQLQILQRHSHRCSSSHSYQYFTHRSACQYQPLVQRHRHMSRVFSLNVSYSVYNPDTGSTDTFTESEYDLAWKTGIGELTACAFTPGGPEALDPAQFAITLNESAPCQWELPVTSPRAAHSPMNQSSGWANILALARAMTTTLTWGGMEFNFAGISNAMSQSRSGASWRHMSLTWRGLCQVGHKLNKPYLTDITLRDIMASAAVSQILTTAGVTSFDLTQLVADDWLIPVLHRQKAKPIDWIMEILTIACLEWRVEGGTHFVVYLPETGTTGNGTWTYDETCIVDEGSEDMSIMDIYNKAIVRRAVEAGEVIEAPPTTFTDMSVDQDEREAVALEGNDPTATECNQFGEYTVEFNPPLNAVHWRVVAAEGGVFSDFKCYTPTSGAQPAAVRDPRPPTTIPQSSMGFGFTLPPTGTAGMYPPNLLSTGALNEISKIIFTWGEAPGNAVTVLAETGTGPTMGTGLVTYVQDNEVLGGYGRIEFMGTYGGGSVSPFPGDAGDGTQYDDTLSVTVTDACGLAALNGEERQIELQLSALFSLANATAIMTRYGTRWLARFGRQLRESSYRMPLNPLLRPGDIINLVEPDMGVTRKLTVRTSTHSYSPSAAGRGTTVRTSEYLC